MRRTQAWISTGLLALLLMVGVGCDAVGTDDEAGTASMRVLLTDAPFPFEIVEEANVTITRVTAVSETEGKVVLSDDDFAVNLLDLRGGVTAPLATEAEIPAGTYTKILLEVQDASVELVGGAEFDLKVPSGQIQVLLGDLEVSLDEDVAVVLDFDVSQSFVVQGNPNTPAGIKGFLFKPVVRSLGWFSDDDDVDEGAELQGTITEVGADYIVVAGTRFQIDDETAFHDVAGFAALAPGMVVEIEYVEAAEDVFVAVAVDVEEDDQEREVHETQGTVEEIGADYLVVAGTRFDVDVETELEGFDSLAALTVGTEVEVDYVEQLNADGYLALEIEVVERETEGD